MTVKDAVNQFKTLNSYVITLGRMSFVELLFTDSIDAKLLCSQDGYALINEAKSIEITLSKFLNQKKRTIKWDKLTKSQITESIETHNFNLFLQLKDDYEKKCSSIVNSIYRNLKDDLLVIQLSGSIGTISHLCDSKRKNKITQKISSLDIQGNKFSKKVLDGPSKIKIDKVFTPSYNILESQIPEFGEKLEEVVPYFWSLSLREILASELCSLSIIEYDNLPLQFYWDFAKQSWDEARHSRIYLNLSTSLFEDLESQLMKESNLYQIIKKYRLTNAGLQVPREKNMYEAILNSQLEERLILMNILTEAPAIGRLTRKLKMLICSKYPEIARVFEFDKIDETFHARIGNYWLKQLIPNSFDRRQKIEDTKLLRGILLLSSISEYSDFKLSEMAENLINCKNQKHNTF